MYRAKKKSAWKVDGSVSTALGFLLVSGGSGTITLKEAGEYEVDFPYFYGGAGYSVGLKYGEKDKYGSDDLSITLPFDLPNGGEIYILDSFDGDELKAEDISGMCLIVELAVGAVALSGSLSGMLIGIPPQEFADEMVLLGGLLGGGSSTVQEVFAKKFKFLRSKAKAVLWLGGINAGVSLSAGITGSIGYIRQAKYRDYKGKIDINSNEKISNPPVRIRDKDPAIVIAGDSLFNWDEAAIKTEGHSKLLEARNKIQARPNRKIQIIGHTDNTEKTPGYNQKLSERRANAVKLFLMGSGVASTRITTEGRGATEPVADNNTKEGREKNRRVEIFILQN